MKTNNSLDILLPTDVVTKIKYKVPECVPKCMENTHRMFKTHTGRSTSTEFRRFITNLTIPSFETIDLPLVVKQPHAYNSHFIYLLRRYLNKDMDDHE